MEREKYLLEQQIIGLKINLHNTDYQAIKFAEGELTEEEFAPIREQRKSWRNEINQLEKRLEKN